MIDKFTTFASIMKLCGIFNIAPLYRKSIYALMHERLDVKMYFGDHSREGIGLLNVPQQQKLSNRYRGTKLVWQKRAIRLALTTKYDGYILTGNAGIRSNWLITLGARMLGRNVYLWSHGLRGNEDKTTLKKNLAYFRLADHILLYGHRAQELLAQHGIFNTTVIYNSLDYDQHLRIRSEVGDNTFLRNYFGNDLPVICYLGRITASKKLDMLLHAITNVRCNLVIVGGGTIEPELQSLADELSISDRVWFYGESFDEQFIGTVLANSAATVSPGSVGLTAIHSLTFGTPVVTHNDSNSQMPEVEALTEGTTGFFYQAGSVDSLSTTIGLAISQPKNSEACHRIIDQRYNPHTQIAILEKLFNRE